MRMSVNKDDPGYHPLAMMCHILFNGKELKNCHTADEGKGIVYVYLLDSYGYFPQDDSELINEELKGKVEIVFPDDWIFPERYHKKKRLRKKLNRR